MNQLTLFVLAMMTELTVFGFLVILRWTAKYAMPLAYFVTAVITLALWGLDIKVVAAASIHGTVTVLNILFSIIGALLLLYTLRESGAIKTLRRAFVTISPDRLISKAMIPMTYYVCAIGALGMAVIVARINFWSLVWLAVVCCILLFMYRNRGSRDSWTGQLEQVVE